RRRPLPGEEDFESARRDAGAGILPFHPDPLERGLVAGVDQAIEAPGETKLEDQVGAEGVGPPPRARPSPSPGEGMAASDRRACARSPLRSGRTRAKRRRALPCR